MKSRSATFADNGSRDYQEDAFLADDFHTIYAVADGMGAASSGRPAADLAIDRLRAHFIEGGKDLRSAIAAANAAVFARTDEADRYWKDPNRKPRPDSGELACWLGKGTTIVALCLARGKAIFAHVGDSRAYLWRNGRLERLTIDHRLVDEARRYGLPEEQIAELPKNVITRALGMRAEVEIEMAEVDARPGDVFLLSSDGLTDGLSDEGIAAVLERCGVDIDDAAASLVKRALENESLDHFDNVTVVLIRVEDSSD